MRLTTWGLLVLACGGQPPDDRGQGASFTGRLLDLMEHADPRNRRLLAMAYPGESAAWQLWHDHAPAITAGELRARVLEATGCA
jgi:hypothetical protein